MEAAPAGKMLSSWPVSCFHRLTACLHMPVSIPPTERDCLNSLPSRTVSDKAKYHSPFKSCGYLVWTRLVRSPPSSKIMLRGCPSLKYRVCSMHHKYSSSVSPFQANTTQEQTHTISQFLTQHVVKQPKEALRSRQTGYYLCLQARRDICIEKKISEWARMKSHCFLFQGTNLVKFWGFTALLILLPC